jgi:biopolymer transport protein ExbD
MNELERMMGERTMRALQTLFVAVVVVFVGSRQGRCEKPDAVESAREVYDHLLKEYQRGKTGLEQVERLGDWSVRIFEAEMLLEQAEAGNFMEAGEKSVDSYLARQKALRKIVQEQVKAGTATDLERKAAQHFEAQAESMKNMFTSALRETGDFDIELPEVELAKPLTVDNVPNLVLNVDKKGDVFVGGKKFDQEQLAELVENAVADNPTLGVVIRADRDCPFENVVSVMGLCQKEGVVDISFAELSKRKNGEQEECDE